MNLKLYLHMFKLLAMPLKWLLGSEIWTKAIIKLTVHTLSTNEKRCTSVMMKRDHCNIIRLKHPRPSSCEYQYCPPSVKWREHIYINIWLVKTSSSNFGHYLIRIKFKEKSKNLYKFIFDSWKATLLRPIIYNYYFPTN